MGNSHNGALIKAYNKFFKDNDNIKIHFLNYRAGKIIDYLDYSSTRIKPNPKIKDEECLNKVKNDLKRIKDLKEYDFIINYGIRLRSWGNGKNNWLELMRQTRNPFSDNARKTSYQDYVMLSPHYEHIMRLTKLKLISPVVSIPSPYPIEHEIPELNINQDYLVLFNEIMKQSIEKLNVSFVNTPDKLNSKTTPYFSNTQFATNRENDYNHLNEEGGRIVLLAIFKYFNLLDMAANHTNHE